MTYMIKPLSYVLIIVLGYMLKCTGFLKDQDRAAFSRVMLGVTLPCAIVQAFDGLSLEAHMLFIVAIGLFCAGMPILLMYLTTRGKDTPLRAYRMLNIGGYNIGCFSVPLLSAFFGSAGGAVLGLYGRILKFAHFQEGGFGLGKLAGFQQNDVAHDQIFTVDRHDLAVAQHAGGGCGHFLQGFDGLFGLAFLIHAQHGVDDNDGQDDDNVGKALAFDHGQNAADGGCGQQDQDHRIHQLVHKTLQERILLALCKLVLAVLFKAESCLFF